MGASIAFIYPSYNPVTGGASVHGYNLARELAALGYRLHTFNREADGFTAHHSLRPWNVIRELQRADLVYCRISLQGRSRRIPALAKRMGKRLIVELNGPADELVATKGIGHDELRNKDRELSTILERADAVITVSEIMSRYIEDTLDQPRPHVIHNGGEIAATDSEYPVRAEIRESVMALRARCETLALWSGSHYPWQGFALIEGLVSQLPDGVGLVVATSDKAVLNRLPKHERLICLEAPQREEVLWLLTQADAGLSLYGEFSWARQGTFFGSSLKFWEYAVNGLHVIASPIGHLADACRNGQAVAVESVQELTKALQGAKRDATPPLHARTWGDVGRETAEVIEQVLKQA